MTIRALTVTSVAIFFNTNIQVYWDFHLNIILISIDLSSVVIHHHLGSKPLSKPLTIVYYITWWKDVILYIHFICLEILIVKEKNCCNCLVTAQ